MHLNANEGPVLEDILFFSPLRWEGPFCRPHHVACRWAATHRVWFWEEPVDSQGLDLEIVERELVTVLVPHLPQSHPDPDEALSSLLDGWLRTQSPELSIGWYWAPRMRSFSHQVRFRTIVRDCLDGVAVGHGEHALLEAAHIVFASQPDGYLARQHLHPNIHLLPDSLRPERSWEATVGHMKRLVAQATPSGANLQPRRAQIVAH